MPSNPGKMLDRLPTKPPPAKHFKYTPPEPMALNYTLLESSPPKDTKLHQSNAKFAPELRYIDNMPMQIKRYAERITVICETQNATIVLMA